MRSRTRHRPKFDFSKMRSGVGCNDRDDSGVKVSGFLQSLLGLLYDLGDPLFRVSLSDRQPDDRGQSPVEEFSGIS